ncbi:MAG: hypothetical protein IPH07_23945 [Deltaproteobacteria bacterium]|nr:hypothetical protein [Deltaproteobacteria bacterium]
MPTTTELSAMTDNESALVVLFDGIEPAFTDDAQLAGLTTGTGHSIRLGLTRDGLSWRIACDLRTGMLLDSPVTFTIYDFEGDLARLFGANDDSQQSLGDVPLGAGLAIHPSDDLTSRTDLHGLNVGVERIGSSGQRRRYPCTPDFEVGLEHGLSLPEFDLVGSPVSDNPIVWTGRRVVLYRCFRDHVTYPSRSAGQTAWRPFSEAVRLWWGTLRDEGEVSGRAWSLRADGPESWLRKPLAIAYQDKPVRAVGEVTLVTSGDEREDGMLVNLYTTSSSGGIIDDQYGLQQFVTFITGTTTDAIRQDVIDEIAAASAATGTDGVWESQTGFHVSMDSEGAIRIAVGAATAGAGVMQLCLHRKVWALLGFDVDLQNALEPADDEPRAISFQPVGEHVTFLTPGPDYWYAQIVTGSTGPDFPAGLNNGGATRVYRPWYDSGTHVLLAALNYGRGQVFRLGDAAVGAGASQSTVVHPGQLDRPPASDLTDYTEPRSIDGTPVDRQGLWLFFGKRRFAGSEEAFDEYWWARASWANAGGQQDGCVFGDTIVVTEWLDSGLFGTTSRGAVRSDWVARTETIDEDDGQVMAVPVLCLGYSQGSGLDLAHVVLQRLLLTTGTSDGWSSYNLDATATLDAGDNEPSGAHVVRRDGEVAALGLGIPAEYVHTPEAFAAEAAKLPNPQLLNTKTVFSPGYQSIDAIRSIVQSMGWAIHLRDGRYGVWCPADPVTLADASIVLDRSVRAVTYKRRRELEQDLRKWAPIDRWSFATAWTPHLNRASRTLELRSTDVGARYRSGDVEQKVMAHAMRQDGGRVERVAQLSRWWALRHFEVRGYPVPMITHGQRMWPGTIVRLTDPELVDPSGSYGVENRLAVVTGVRTTMGVNEGITTVDLLVFADRSNTPRLHAFSARGIGYDEATDDLYVADNWLGIESDGTWSDAAFFTEPLYTAIAQYGGDAVIEWWQWDGETISQTGAGTVSSVSTVSGSSRIRLTSTSGTYYRDMDTIVVLRPTTTANAAWIDALYSPICNDAGTWTDVAATTDGYPWET